jgi:predicted  nucleic acid-binding Zn ribbon protein
MALGQSQADGMVCLNWYDLETEGLVRDDRAGHRWCPSCKAERALVQKPIRNTFYALCESCNDPILIRL